MSDQVLITTSKLVSLADSVRSHASLSEKLKLPEIPGLIGADNEEYGVFDPNGNLLKSEKQLIDDGVIAIDNGVLKQSSNFYNSGLWYPNGHKWLFSPNVESIAADTFSYIGGDSGQPNIRIMEFSDSLTKIETRAFRQIYNIILDIIFPDTLQETGDYNIDQIWGRLNYYKPEQSAFYYPSSIKKIGAWSTNMAVDGNYKYDVGYLKDIYIPSGCTSISTLAFKNFENLTIHYSGTATGAPWGAKSTVTVVP